MPDQQTCTVSFFDAEGFRHSVQINAASLFEAAALGLKAFQLAAFLDRQPGIATVLEVSVSQPAVTHHVTIKKLQDWLTSGSKSPSDQSLKIRLREMLGGELASKP